jgi:hypothetical protein
MQFWALGPEAGRRGMGSGSARGIRQATDGWARVLRPTVGGGWGAPTIRGGPRNSSARGRLQPPSASRQLFTLIL